MDEASRAAFSQYQKRYFQILLLSPLFMILLLVVTAYLAQMMSRRLTGPIKHMISALDNIAKDSFTFEMEDIYRTDDEIEVLAETFDELSDRTKLYIQEITEITAEKERIGAELDVAARIQEDMLPNEFPAFPDKDEFELFASMTPAKEVGGDFYDFFMVDDDHLALVIADVSGKGVPAALFMVVTKTLIKNAAQLGKTPSEVFGFVNDRLCEGNTEGFFVTAWMVIIEISTGKGIAVNAGHEHPVIRRAGGEWELVIYKHSLVLGSMEGMHFREH
jgi:sigma-B regulation protein RsbU (phosphoserine phosphatase)